MIPVFYFNICFDQMDGLFTYTYHKKQEKIYAIHGFYGYKLFIAYSNLNYSVTMPHAVKTLSLKPPGKKKVKVTWVQKVPYPMWFL